MKDFKELIKIADVYGADQRELYEKKEANALDEGWWDDLKDYVKDKLGLDDVQAAEIATDVQKKTGADPEAKKATGVAAGTGASGPPGREYDQAPSGPNTGPPGRDNQPAEPSGQDYAGGDAGGEFGGTTTAQQAAQDYAGGDAGGEFAGTPTAVEPSTAQQAAQDYAGGDTSGEFTGTPTAAPKPKGLDIQTPNLMKAYNQGGKKPMDNIKAMQVALQKVGHDPKGADGKYGPGTFAAVKAFQTASGLKADGQAGPETMKALQAASTKPQQAGGPNTPPPGTKVASGGPNTPPPGTKVASGGPNTPPPGTAPGAGQMYTEASMNISMNGTDAREVEELVGILKNAGVDEPKSLAIKSLPPRPMDGPMDGPMPIGKSPMDKKPCSICGGMHEEYDAVVAEWDNAPDPEYKDDDFMLRDLAGGINRPKKSFPPVNGGDNPMKMSVKEELYKALKSKKAKK